MNLKKVLAGLALVCASSGAFAQLQLPSSGDGSLMLTAFDQVTQTSYVLDTGITFSQVLGGAPIAVNTDPSFAAIFAGVAPSAIEWNLSASDNTTDSGIYIGRQLLSTAPSGVGGLTNNGLLSSQTRIENFIIEVNDVIGMNNAVTSSSSGDNWNAGNTSGIAPFADDFGGSFAAGNTGSLGDTLELVLITAGTSTDFFGNVTASAGDLVNKTLTGIFASLSQNGVLTVGSTTVVPVPAAVWLFGAGLVGLLGIGRRKSTAVAA